MVQSEETGEAGFEPTTFSFGGRCSTVGTILLAYYTNMRIRGIEPLSSAWKADNLPLIYIRPFTLRIILRNCFTLYRIIANTYVLGLSQRCVAHKRVCKY